MKRGLLALLTLGDSVQKGLIKIQTISSPKNGIAENKFCNYCCASICVMSTKVAKASRATVTVADFFAKEYLTI
jgi:hypothetical protein